MAYRASDVFTDVAGQTIFQTTHPFEQSQEAVYLEGIKLTPGLDYSVTQPDTVILSTPVAEQTYILEILTYTEDTVSEEIDTKLDNILTAVSGSWLWDKSDQRITMYDTYGNVQFVFSVEDTLDVAKRERRQDLEI